MTLSELQSVFVTKLKRLYTKEEAERLFFIGLEDILNIGVHQFRIVHQKNVQVEDENKMIDFLTGLKQGTPYQHLIGNVTFAGLDLKVGPQALIPRPETEELAYLIKEENIAAEGLRLIDIGTGTGCLALACAGFLKNSEVHGFDVSDEALQLAHENSKRNKLDVGFTKGSILIEEEWPDGKWDLIVSNPPYIGEREEEGMNSTVKDFEPSLALFAPDDDILIFYRKILEFADKNLKKGGKLYLEINQQLGEQTKELYSRAGYEAQLLKDMSGNDRFVVATKK